MQLVFSIVRSISLFSITQTVIIACIPYALKGQCMSVAPQCERWVLFSKLTKQNEGVIENMQMSISVSYKTNNECLH